MRLTKVWDILNQNENKFYSWFVDFYVILYFQDMKTKHFLYMLNFSGWQTQIHVLSILARPKLVKDRSISFEDAEYDSRTLS